MRHRPIFKADTFTIHVGSGGFIALRFRNTTPELIGPDAIYQCDENTPGVFDIGKRRSAGLSAAQRNIAIILEGLQAHAGLFLEHPALDFRLARCQAHCEGSEGIPSLLPSEFAFAALQFALPCADAVDWQMQHLGLAGPSAPQLYLQRFAETLQAFSPQLQRWIKEPLSTPVTRGLASLRASLARVEAQTAPLLPPSLRGETHEILQSICRSYDVPSSLFDLSGIEDHLIGENHEIRQTG